MGFRRFPRFGSLRFEQVGGNFDFLEFGGDDGLAVGGPGVVGEVVLVVVFGFVKGACFFELGDDGVAENVVLGELVHEGPGGLFFFFVVVEDDGAVLGAHVRALSVEGGGVVDGEKDLQEILVADEVGIVGDLNDFGVAGTSAGHFAVGGVGGVAALVAGHHVGDAFEFFEEGFEAPEAASAKGGPAGFVVGVGHGGGSEGQEGE